MVLTMNSGGKVIVLEPGADRIEGENSGILSRLSNMAIYTAITKTGCKLRTAISLAISQWILVDYEVKCNESTHELPML